MAHHGCCPSLVFLNSYTITLIQDHCFFHSLWTGSCILYSVWGNPFWDSRRFQELFHHCIILEWGTDRQECEVSNSSHRHDEYGVMLMVEVFYFRHLGTKIVVHIWSSILANYLGTVSPLKILYLFYSRHTIKT